MRMLIVSFASIILIMLVWGLFYYMSIETVVEFFDKELRNMYALIDNNNYDQAQVNINEILDRWRETEKLWVYFIHQGDVDEIGASILKINVYIKTENKSMVLSEIEQLKKTLKMVQGNESLTLENIF